MWSQFFLTGSSRPLGSTFREGNIRQALRRTQIEIAELEIRFRKLNSVAQGLWEILKVELDLEDDVLSEIVSRQDTSSQNGLEPIDAPKCPDCHRSFSKRTGSCVYCGATVVQNNLF